MDWTDIPMLATFDVLAPLVEWAVHISVSTPALFNTTLIHPAIVLDLTGLWGLTELRNSLPLRRASIFWYVLDIHSNTLAGPTYYPL